MCGVMVIYLKSVWRGLGYSAQYILDSIYFLFVLHPNVEM